MKLFVIAIASAVAVIEPIPSVRFEKHGLLPANETRPGGAGGLESQASLDQNLT
jgi:hypothetical protein